MRYFITLMQIVRRTLARPNTFWLTLVVFSVWFFIVIFLAAHHEFRRDEVRALSLAREAHWPWQLFALTREDGHPVLWYLLLYLGWHITHSPLVLPVVSIAIAFASVVVVMRFAPFPFWFKCLFIFGGLPLYEYAVTARNYGIGMLLLLIAAALYPHRAKQGWWLALVLALLANTNVHSALIVCVIAVVWFANYISSQRNRVSDQIAAYQFALIAASVVLCALTTWPTDNTILTSAHRSFHLDEFTLTLLKAIFRPDLTFTHLAPEQLSPVITAALLMLAVVGLLRRLDLFAAAIAAQVLLGALFLQVYSGSYRHEGLYLIFLLFLYWQHNQSSNNKSREYKPSFLGKPSLYSRGFYFGLVPLLCLNLVLAGQYAWDDAQHALSSNHALGTWLQQHPAYNNAILMAEPDYIIESLPYYADNPLYLLREGRFGKTVSWTTASSQRMSLGQLLVAAQKIQHQEQRPVLIVLGHLDIDAAKKQTAGEKDYSYNKIFAWGAEDWLEFTSATQPIATFGDATSDENYEVYVLRPQ